MGSVTIDGRHVFIADAGGSVTISKTTPSGKKQEVKVMRGRAHLYVDGEWDSDSVSGKQLLDRVDLNKEEIQKIDNEIKATAVHSPSSFTEDPESSGERPRGGWNSGPGGYSLRGPRRR